MAWTRDSPLLDDWDGGPLSGSWTSHSNGVDQMSLSDNLGDSIQDNGEPDNEEHHNHQYEQQRKKQFYFYQEAAIFLAEGLNNDKFNTHPHCHEALPAYQAAHNHWFYCLDFLAALVVVMLAVSERPAIKHLEMPVGIHSSIELLCLLILSLELGIRYKWLGWKVFFKHKRTMFKLFLIIMMLIETIVVLIRQANHFRVTRALRPLFLLHTHYCRGLRRITRQIIQCIPPIAKMLLLLIFFMLIFSILGFYLFAGIPKDRYFHTIQDSFVSLFVLLTTSNYPDVMMPAYNQSVYYSFFFIIYLALEMWVLSNLLLSVVVDTFQNLLKSKFRALWIHKRDGCDRAFRLLSTQSGDHNTLDLKNFVGMMEHFAPNKTRKEYYLMFKHLNTSKSGELTLEEFYNVYKASSFRWKLRCERTLWSSNCPEPLNKIMEVLNWLVTRAYFDYLIYVIIGGNFIWIMYETGRISIRNINPSSYDFTASWISIVFVCTYCVEAALKILGRGPKDYFTQGWDLFDFIITLISVVGVFGAVFENSFYYVMVLRPFRLLRLCKSVKSYRNVLGTLVDLSYKLLSLAICIMIIYYFYAIIGMEMFLGKDLHNCCKNTSVESYYQYNNVTKEGGFYYLNNFDDLFRSCVTLFELTIVNNWFIIMDGYAYAVSEWTRIYFMLFYLTMSVVLNMLVAFVLESFLFRINYGRKLETDLDNEEEQENLILSQDEMNMVVILSCSMTGQYITQEPQGENVYQFVGERKRDRDDFSLSMYRDEVQNWSSEYETNRKEVVNSLEQMRIRDRPNYDTNPHRISINSEPRSSMSSNFSNV